MQAESEEAAKKQRLKEIEERERRAGGGADLKSPDANANTANSPLDETSRFLDLDDHGMLHGYDRPEPMAHILTEDGEPMLNPGWSRRFWLAEIYRPDALFSFSAELLTQVCTSLEFEMLHALLNKAVMNFQESLASPPPS